MFKVILNNHKYYQEYINSFNIKKNIKMKKNIFNFKLFLNKYIILI